MSNTGIPGDRQATDAEVAAWLASLVTIDRVQAECQRRIDAAIGLNAKLNLLGTMVANLITANHADDANFLASMQWIASMKGAVEGLVGNVAFDQDASWPPLSDALKAFGARF
ncbi:hypothetical protein [Labrys neptuniae]